MTNKKTKKNQTTSLTPAGIADNTAPVITKVAVYEPLSFGKVFLKATLLALFFASIMLVVTAGVVGLYFYKQAQIFARTSQTSLSQLKELFQEGWKAEPIVTNGKKKLSAIRN